MASVALKLELFKARVVPCMYLIVLSTIVGSRTANSLGICKVFRHPAAIAVCRTAPLHRLQISRRIGSQPTTATLIACISDCYGHHALLDHRR
jgi:hypothetical protein